MKIALCLSGQPRALHEGFSFIRRNLLEEYEVDVFVHSWNTHLNTAVRKLYRPKKYLFEDPMFNEEHDVKYKYTDEENVWPPRNALSGFYSIYNSNRLKKEYEEEHGFIYDWVVRSRFDYALNTCIPFAKLNNSILYAPIRKDQPLCDQFAFSGSMNMDMYSETFNHIDEFYNDGCWLIGEHLLIRTLRRYELNTKINFFNMKRPFNNEEDANAGLIRTDQMDWKNRS